MEGAAQAPSRSEAAAAGPVVVDVIPEGESIVPAILERAERDGVPLRNSRMEYKSLPASSPLLTCGLPLLEEAASRGDACKKLVEELRGRGVKSQDRAEIGAAALCLMLGGLDEAHNIVTPHSWSEPTTFGGQPKHGSEMVIEASLCHHIIHRNEGEHLGEFGTGFNNSAYWISRAGEHSLFVQLRAMADQLAEGCSEATATLRAMGPTWKPKSFNGLCEEMLLLEEEELINFVARVQATELRLLFDHVTADANI